jgi:hypothetical protein
MSDYNPHQPPANWNGPGAFVGYNCSPPSGNRSFTKGELAKIVRDNKDSGLSAKVYKDIQKKQDELLRKKK